MASSRDHGIRAGFELDVLLARALALKVGNAWSKVGRLKRNKPPHRWKVSDSAPEMNLNFSRLGRRRPA